VRLPASFFARRAIEVAPELLGCRLIHELPDGSRLAGRIVEVEAYLGDGTDGASHSHRGPTPRSRTMFGPPGHFYVYRSMGIHRCANIVCEPEGHASAVLLRAVEPLEGQARMRVLRGERDGVELCNGPGKLCQAFDIELAHDGHDARDGALRVEGPVRNATHIMAGPRIGISKAVELPYRFFLANSPWVTRSSLNRAARTCSKARRA